jgi:hypothetical protein
VTGTKIQLRSFLASSCLKSGFLERNRRSNCRDGFSTTRWHPLGAVPLKSRALAWVTLWIFGGLFGALTNAIAQNRQFGELAGICVKFSQGEPAEAIQDLKELGIKWVRDNVDWHLMEPSPGKYLAFPPEFQARLDFYKANDISIIFLLSLENAVAYPNTPANPHNSTNAAAFGRFAAALAKLMKASGVPFVIEIGNEPHNFTLRPQYGGQFNGAPPSPWLDHYMAMVHEAVNQVKTYDPKVKLMTCDDMWIIHYWMLEKGLPQKLDAISFHPYINDSCVGPEEGAIEPTTSWTQPFICIDADRSFSSAVRRLREQAQLKLGRSPEMWITEWGFAVGQKVKNGVILSEDMVAAFVPRAFISAASAGVQVLCWFSTQDSVDGPMGLRTNDGKRRKAFGAYRTMTRQIGHYTLERQIVGQDKPTSGVQAHLFRSDKDNKLVIWNIDGEASVVLDNVANARIEVRDIQGKRLAVNQNKDGLVRLSVTPAPIYVAGVPTNVTLKLLHGRRVTSGRSSCRR